MRANKPIRGLLSWEEKQLLQSRPRLAAFSKHHWRAPFFALEIGGGRSPSNPVAVGVPGGPAGEQAREMLRGPRRSTL